MKISCTLRPLISTKSVAIGFLIPLFFLLVATRAAAWGPVGHETVAYIAEDNLTPAAKQKIAALLYEGDTLETIANWADKVRMFGRPETAPWHFIDLPIRKDLTIKDEMDYFQNNNCVVSQLQIDEGILGDESQPRSKRYEALKFLVHFMGDLHQPLHCADDNDRGGNEKLVRYQEPWKRGKGAKIKLHALWDAILAPKTKEDPRKMATGLESEITAQDRTDWVKGNENDWAFESYQIAKTKIYPGMDPGPQDYTDNPLPKDYYEKMRPFACKQIEKAGIRLAFVLNEILK